MKLVPSHQKLFYYAPCLAILSNHIQAPFFAIDNSWYMSTHLLHPLTCCPIMPLIIPIVPSCPNIYRYPVHTMHFLTHFHWVIFYPILPKHIQAPIYKLHTAWHVQITVLYHVVPLHTITSLSVETHPDTLPDTRHLLMHIQTPVLSCIMSFNQVSSHPLPCYPVQTSLDTTVDIRYLLTHVQTPVPLCLILSFLPLAVPPCPNTPSHSSRYIQKNVQIPIHTSLIPCSPIVLHPMLSYPVQTNADNLLDTKILICWPSAHLLSDIQIFSTNDICCSNQLTLKLCKLVKECPNSIYVGQTSKINVPLQSKAPFVFRSCQPNWPETLTYQPDSRIPYCVPHDLLYL